MLSRYLVEREIISRVDDFSAVEAAATMPRGSLLGPVQRGMDNYRLTVPFNCQLYIIDVSLSLADDSLRRAPGRQCDLSYFHERRHRFASGCRSIESRSKALNRLEDERIFLSMNFSCKFLLLRKIKKSDFIVFRRGYVRKH